MGPCFGGDDVCHQGLYGLISDNLMNLNVVLAKDTTVKVDETSHVHLFWGMKGTGHNFGVVTSFELTI
jgi:FAD/FMN-containing dehydrogenase